MNTPARNVIIALFNRATATEMQAVRDFHNHADNDPDCKYFRAAIDAQRDARVARAAYYGTIEAK